MAKIGFACKWIDFEHQTDGIKITDDCKQFNTGTTTITWLRRQTREVAEQKLWDLMVQNIESTRKLVERVGTLDDNLRMVRLSSDLLPAYTEPSWSYFWRLPATISYLETHFSQIGELARNNNVRLSFHPGQFTVLASDNPDIVNRSIEEFEYHADMARWMGFGQKFQDFKINVHIAGRQGPEGIRLAYQRLSTEARNCITIENEENSWGLNDCLTLTDTLPIVLDIHHHFIREGEYIEVTDPRVQKVIDSWKGVRPTFHYSQSREDYLNPHLHTTKTKMSELLEQGYKKQKLRAHSDFMWNQEINKWALTHLQWGDMMVECKSKNLGAHQLFEFWKCLENPVSPILELEANISTNA